ncbi:dehydrogenase containing FAD binding domain [Rivularia sp. IAM M-261]|nr:dehydrogenase containing FAD binding domain [Rivularia sp. IAM M-261]
MTQVQNSVSLDLKGLIGGEVISTQETLKEFSQDFGRIITKQPQVIVRPYSAKDVSQVITYARNYGLTVTPRATGNSLGGQCLNQDGIILDMRGLNTVHEINQDELYFQADAGTSWRQVVELSLPQNLIPPVLTNYIDVSVGGTHAVGGIGASSFRYGTQADNCLALEVVTSNGEILWCSSEENSELFNHVLCGYSQFGIITQVRHRLKTSHNYTRTYYFVYDNLDALLQDKHTLTSQNKIDYLLSVPSPSLELLSKAKGVQLTQWFYLLEVTVEINDTNSTDDILSNLNFYRHVRTETKSFKEFIIPSLVLSPPVNTVHPWIDLILPASQAKAYIETTLERLPSVLDCSHTLMGSFCLYNKSTKLPMFSVPNEEFMIGFGIYPIIPEFQLQPVLTELKSLTDLAFKHGGKRYLSGWVDFNQQQWQTQFGDYWPKLNELKNKYDPYKLIPFLSIANNT